jgi:hypothetical protein
MVSEGDTTIGAFEGETTIRTEDKMSKSPSIEKEEALFLVFNIFLKRRLYLF